MTKIAANRIADLPQYIFARLKVAADEASTSSGRKVLDLGAGSPDIPPSMIYREKYAEFVKLEKSHLYPGYGATAEFSTSLKTWYRKRFDVRLVNEQILPLNGAKDGISHLPLALFDENDEVLVPDPGYPAFSDPASLVGAKVVPYSLGDSFKLDIDKIDAQVNSKTKAVWVNFPSNPTGQIATITELEKLIIYAKNKNIIVLYDNAYSEIVFQGFTAPSILQIPGAEKIAIEIGSFSKSHSFAGYRMGWIVGNEEIVKALAKVKSQIDSGMSLPLQMLASYSLANTDNSWLQSTLSEYQHRLDVVAGHLRSMGFEFELPKGGLYVWAKLPKTTKSSEEFCLDLLKNKQILLTPGTAFGKNGEGYVRASICTNIDNIEDYFA